MCGKAILENVGTVPECYKLCDKAVNTYLSTIKFVPECFMTQVCESLSRYVIKQLIDMFDLILPLTHMKLQERAMKLMMIL